MEEEKIKLLRTKIGSSDMKLNRWWKLTQFKTVIWAVYNGSESFVRGFWGNSDAFVEIC